MKGYPAVKVHAERLGDPVVSSEAIEIPLQRNRRGGPPFTNWVPSESRSGEPLTMAEINKTAGVVPNTVEKISVKDGVTLRTALAFVTGQYKSKGYMDCVVTPRPQYDDANASSIHPGGSDGTGLYDGQADDLKTARADLRAAMLAAWKLPRARSSMKARFKRTFIRRETLRSTHLCLCHLPLQADSEYPDPHHRCRATAGKKALTPAILIPCPTHSSFDHMFLLPASDPGEAASPVIVYLVLVLLLRSSASANWPSSNPFDLVVLLSLSNTVQNAIIGDDNSVTGGLIGAFSLLAINWLGCACSSALAAHQRDRGPCDGARQQRPDRPARPPARVAQPRGAARRHSPPGLRGFRPGPPLRTGAQPATFYVEAFDPSAAKSATAELLARLDALTREVAALRPQPAGD